MLFSYYCCCVLFEWILMWDATLLLCIYLFFKSNMFSFFDEFEDCLIYCRLLGLVVLCWFVLIVKTLCCCLLLDSTRMIKLPFCGLVFNDVFSMSFYEKLLVEALRYFPTHCGFWRQYCLYHYVQWLGSTTQEIKTFWYWIFLF